MRQGMIALSLLLAMNASAAFTPCNRATSVFVVTASPTPGMMHVHFENTNPPLGLGYDPRPLRVTVNGNDLEIRQWVYGGGIDPLPGQPHLCQSEDVDIPALAPGTFTGRWTYAAQPPYGQEFAVGGYAVHFAVADPLPQVSCAAAPAPVAYVSERQLAFSDLVTLQPASFDEPDVAFTDGVITVSQRYTSDIYSDDFETRCYSATVPLPFALPPGHYDVVWIYKSPYGEQRSLAAVEVVQPSRRHSSRRQ